MATASLTTTPTTIAAASDGSVYVTNTGASRVTIVNGTETTYVRRGRSTNIVPAASVTARVLASDGGTGSISYDVAPVNTGADLVRVNELAPGAGGGVTGNGGSSGDAGQQWGPPIGHSLYTTSAAGTQNNVGTSNNVDGRLCPIELPGPMTFDMLSSRFDVIGGATEVSYYALYRAGMGQLTFVGELGSYAPLALANFSIVAPVPLVVTQGVHYVVWVNEGSTNTAKMRAVTSQHGPYAWTHDPANLGVNQAPLLNTPNPRPGGVWSPTLTSFTQIAGGLTPLLMLRRSA